MCDFVAFEDGVWARGESLGMQLHARGSKEGAAGDRWWETAVFGTADLDFAFDGGACAENISCTGICRTVHRLEVDRDRHTSELERYRCKRGSRGDGQAEGDQAKEGQAREYSVGQSPYS